MVVSFINLINKAGLKCIHYKRKALWYSRLVVSSMIKPKIERLKECNTAISAVVHFFLIFDPFSPKSSVTATYCEI